MTHAQQLPSATAAADPPELPPADLGFLEDGPDGL
jgi:hypothetical protein